MKRTLQQRDVPDCEPVVSLSSWVNNVPSRPANFETYISYILSPITSRENIESMMRCEEVKQLFQVALTHGSSTSGQIQNNDVLEKLGDGILKAAFLSFLLRLYQENPTLGAPLTAHALTNFEIFYLSGPMQVRMAKALRIPEWLQVGEEVDIVDEMAEDAYEAMVAAIHTSFELVHRTRGAMVSSSGGDGSSGGDTVPLPSGSEAVIRWIRFLHSEIQPIVDKVRLGPSSSRMYALSALLGLRTDLVKTQDFPPCVPRKVHYRWKMTPALMHALNRRTGKQINPQILLSSSIFGNAVAPEDATRTFGRDTQDRYRNWVPVTIQSFLCGTEAADTAWRTICHCWQIDDEWIEEQRMASLCPVDGANHRTILEEHLFKSFGNDPTVSGPVKFYFEIPPHSSIFHLMTSYMIVETPHSQPKNATKVLWTGTPPPIISSLLSKKLWILHQWCPQLLLKQKNISPTEKDGARN